MVSAKRASVVSFQRAGALPPLLFIDLQEESSPEESSRFERRVTPKLTCSGVTAPELQKPEEQISTSPAIPNFFLIRLFNASCNFCIARSLVYPYDFRLTEKEKTSICYLSFPDSYSGGLGDTQFSFRLRQSGGQRTTHYEDDGEYNREAPLTLQRESAHYFGYVYFRQVKDSSMKRGYFQKSLVLVSRLPYVNLFQSLLQLIAPEYFDKLEPCLEAVCNEIDQWPPPVPGQTLNLPVMGVVIQVRIPSRVDKPGSSPVKQFNQENLLPAPLVLPSIHELDLFRCFQPVLIHVQMLWELMLLGEPIVVMAPSPTVSSEMVLALTSCLAPLRYCCDYRPYFTIHDSEFKEYTTRTQAPPNIVVGVTNPFFIKTLQHWPHILRVGELRMSGDLPKQVKVKKLAKLKTLDTKPGSRRRIPPVFPQGGSAFPSVHVSTRFGVIGKRRRDTLDPIAWITYEDTKRRLVSTNQLGTGWQLEKELVTTTLG
ncbi:PREDICTED: protein DENND6B, partial [Charadrius vociferus]|uniref:protein DENND6B n=1 Tax=Charadrius vociferus TaxID=50402 RepID=UPI00052141BB